MKPKPETKQPDRETGSEARKLNMIDRVVRLAKIKKEKVEK